MLKTKASPPEMGPRRRFLWNEGVLRLFHDRMNQGTFLFLGLHIQTDLRRRLCTTPSTTYWTADVMDVLPFGVWHLGIDNYFTVGRKPTSQGVFPTDVGFTVGVLPFSKLNLEIGFDILEPIDFSVC